MKYKSGVTIGINKPEMNGSIYNDMSLAFRSIYTVFERVLKGENSEKLIKGLRPYINDSLIEAAVMQGVLSYSVLEPTP